MSGADSTPAPERVPDSPKEVNDEKAKQAEANMRMLEALTKENEELIAAEKLRQDELRSDYSRLRNEREQATFAMTMRMDSSALAEIRKEFFARSDEVTLEEFIYIIEKHLNKADMNEKEHKEFVANMLELFKDIDVNGDGMMEWSEFTTFTVEKANILNKKMKFTNIANYHDSSEKLDPSSQHRHRHDFSAACPIKNLNQFALLEDNRNAIFVYNSHNAKLIKTIAMDAVPQAIIHVVKHDLLVSACADMTMTTHSLDDPNPNKKYKLQSTWATPGIQMALAYVENKDVLYSGGANGNIYAWDIKARNLLATIPAHNDIVMKLLVLKNLNTLVSTSLDTNICIWDVYTHSQIMKLQGHKKGVFNIDYNPEYRLLFSCGFDHDVCVWSPFVSSMIYRLKGHHATLVGVVCVEGSPEIITGDSAGVFKLWDVRKFQCIQTFFATSSHLEFSGSLNLNCFFHLQLPSSNVQQREDDSRIFAASKTIYSFDQGRVVHEATTDFSAVQWVQWVESSSTILTVSDTNLIIWDVLSGSKTTTHNNICGHEISAVCLDNRKRKLVVGDVLGNIGVYNPLNGALMKSTTNDADADPSAVVSLIYVNVDNSRRFLAGFANGLIRLYNEESLEDCGLIRYFDTFYSYRELSSLIFSETDRTVVCIGAASPTAKMWDFDTGKCDADLAVADDPEHVMKIFYLDPYPLFITSDSYGNIIIWGSRNSKWPGRRISGFLNMTPPSAEVEPRNRLIEHEADEHPRRSFPATEEEYEAYFAQSEVAPQIDELLENAVKNSNVPKVTSVAPKISKKAGRNIPIVSRTNSTNDCMTLVEKLAEQKYHDLSRALEVEGEKKWGKVAPSEAIAWNAEKFWLYTGDEQGNLRKWDLSALMNELDAPAMLSGMNPQMKGELGSKPRDRFTALVPKFHNLMIGPNLASLFQVSRRHIVSNLGVSFVWAVGAHNDRVVHAISTEYGVITSATDKLVKMWTHDGLPVGVLMQSVPVGMKNRAWELCMDVEDILKKEDEEMVELMKRVEVTAQNPDKPDLSSMSFAGMAPGKGSAEFNRSVLRQRIHKTSSLLGLNFVVEDGPDVPSIYDPNGSLSVGSLDDASLAGTESIASSVVSKTLKQALVELKSTEITNDTSIKNQLLSAVQLRRKDAKVAMVAKKYESNRKYKLPAIKKAEVESDQSEPRARSRSASPSNMTGSPDKLNFDIDKTLGIASVVTTGSSVNGQSSHFSDIGTRFSPKKKKKHTMKIDFGGASRIQKRCGKYSTFDNLEKVLTMDTKTMISPRTIEMKRKENENLGSFYRPLSVRMPSLFNMISRVNSSKDPLDEQYDSGSGAVSGTAHSRPPSGGEQILSQSYTQMDGEIEN